MKMKMKAIIISLLFTGSAFASTYLVTLDDKHYNNAIVIKNNEPAAPVYPKCQVGQPEITYDDLRALIVAGSDIINVCTSGITNMSYLFSRKQTTSDISGWDVSNVTDMSYMFHISHNFNQDVSGWDTSSVTNLEGFLIQANSNPNISGWNTSNVTNGSYIFYQNPIFNGDLSKWDVSKATTMTQMFYEAVAFNKDIGDWDTGNVTDMHYMFNHADAFTHDLSTWNVNKVTRHENFSRYTQMSGVPTFP
jgi:surface protein